MSSRVQPACLVAAAGAALLSAAASAASLPVQVAGITGQIPMQVPVGTVHAGFGIPVIDGNGWFVAYTGTVSGANTVALNDEMVFRTGLIVNQTLPIARESQVVLGTNNEWTYDGAFADVRVGGPARVAFSAEVRKVGTPSLGRGVFSTSSQTFAFGLPQQQVVFGLPQAAIGTLWRGPAMNTASTVAAAFDLTGAAAPAGQSTGLWTGSAGLLLSQLVARGTLTAPGVGVEFGMVPEGNHRLTNDGNLYFGAGLWGVGSGDSAHGIWGGDPASPALIVRGGPIGPLSSLGQPVLVSAASNQHVLFAAKYFTVLTTPETDEALWLWTVGTRRIVAQEGDEAPGLKGAQFDWLGIQSCVNTQGHVAFPAGLRGAVTPGGDTGIWLDTGSELRMVVRESTPAAGLPGLTLGQIEAVSLNQADQIAFFTTLVGPGVTPDNDGSLWVWGPAAGLALVAREGDAVALSTGGSRVLETIAVKMGGPDDGMGTCLSNDGRIAYRAAFTDATSAVLVATVPQSCYANCDASTTPPILNVADFSCFLNLFASGATTANCDGSSIPPVLNVGDFSCFLNRFAAGCP